MKRSEDYEVRFGRLSAWVEKWLVILIISLVCFLFAAQGLIHQYEPLRSLLIETEKWEGSTQIRQK